MFKKANTLLKSILVSTVVVFATVLLCADLLRIDTSIAAVENLPVPGTMVTLSKSYVPPLLEAISFDKENPQDLTFYIDPNDAQISSQEDNQRLVEYFLTALTVPQEHLWVNLSPYESQRVVEDDFVATQMGRDLLAQDYMLKQVSASITNPATALGEAYWSRVNSEELGVNRDSFSKIWIVPDTALVYENGLKAAVADTYLKLMTEADYYAMSQENNIESGSSSESINKILPELEYEVNNGKNFAPLRQIYNSLVLASWFKAKFMNTFYQHYINRNKITGVDTASKESKENIYKLYVESFKKGAYDFVRKEKKDGQAIKKRYFSGGARLGNKIEKTTNSGAIEDLFSSSVVAVKYSLKQKLKNTVDYIKNTLDLKLVPRLNRVSGVLATLGPLMLIMAKLSFPSNVSAQEAMISQSPAAIVVEHQSSTQKNPKLRAVEIAYGDWVNDFADAVAYSLGSSNRNQAMMQLSSYLNAGLQALDEAEDSEQFEVALERVEIAWEKMAYATDQANLNTHGNGGARSRMAQAYINHFTNSDYYNVIRSSSADSAAQESMIASSEQCAMIAMLQDWLFYQMKIIKQAKAIRFPGHIALIFELSGGRILLFDLSYKIFDVIEPGQLRQNGDGFDYIGNNPKISALFDGVESGKIHIASDVNLSLYRNLAHNYSDMGMHDKANEAIAYAFADTLTLAFDDAHIIRTKQGNVDSIAANLKSAIDFTYRHQLLTDYARYRNTYSQLLLNKVVTPFMDQGDSLYDANNNEQALRYYQVSKNIIASIESNDDTLSMDFKSALAADPMQANLIIRTNAYNTLLDNRIKVVEAATAFQAIYQQEMMKLNQSYQESQNQGRTELLPKIELEMLLLEIDRSSLSFDYRATAALYDDALSRLDAISTATISNKAELRSDLSREFASNILLASTVAFANLIDRISNMNGNIDKVLIENELVPIKQDMNRLDVDSLNASQKGLYDRVDQNIRAIEEELETLSSSFGGIDLAKININIKSLQSNDLPVSSNVWGSMVGLTPVFKKRNPSPNLFPSFIKN